MQQLFFFRFFRKYCGNLSWKNIAKTITAVTLTSLLVAIDSLYGTFSRIPSHYSVLHHLGLYVLARTVRHFVPCYMLPYCCWLRRGSHNSSSFRVPKMWVRYRYQGRQVIQTSITQHVACINISLSISIYTLSTHKQIYSGIEQHFNGKQY